MSFIHDGSTIPLAPVKDPDSTIDYGCDWSSWLAESENISASSWLVSGLDTSGEVNNGVITGVTLSGGTVGESYQLTNRVTTSFGRTEDRSMIIRCLNK